MSKSNPFDLPPPWSPGYALPQNVVDEGLERHGYVTQWARRGTFDNPKVGDSGYAVPGYVREENYGRGAFVTKWAPRGSYFGPKVSHWLDRPSARVVGRKPMPGGATKLKIQTMGGVEQAVGGAGLAPITAYGLDVATSLIDTVRMMPPDLRKKQLKLALDKIDPKLWAKAEAGADAAAKLGVPPDLALERGLGAAMSYGLTNELVDLAKGKRPPERSQLGNAACMLGDTAPTRADYCWVGPNPGGHWERMLTGQTGCADPQPAGVAAPTVRTGSSGGVSGGGRPVGYRPQTAPPADQVFANIGPFLIPVNARAYSDHRPLTAEKKKFVDENIAIAAKAGEISIAEMRTGKYPFVKFKGGEHGDELWGLYYLENKNGTTVSYHKIPGEKASELGAYEYESLGWSIGGALSSVGGAIKDAASATGGAIKDAAKAVAGAVWHVLKKIWKGIKWVTMKVVHFVVDAAKWVAKMTCKLTATPGVVQGAQAVATAAPNPYTVGIAAGITVTKMICDAACSPASSCPPGSDAAKAAAEAQAQAEAAALAAAAEAAASRKKMTFLLLGGVGVAAAVLMLGGKKKP